MDWCYEAGEPLCEEVRSFFLLIFRTLGFHIVCVMGSWDMPHVPQQALEAEGQLHAVTSLLPSYLGSSSPGLGGRLPHPLNHLASPLFQQLAF